MVTLDIANMFAITFLFLISAVLVKPAASLTSVTGEQLTEFTADDLRSLCPNDYKFCAEKIAEGRCFGNSKRAGELKRKCACSCNAAHHKRIQNCCSTVGRAEMQFCLPLCAYNTTLTEVLSVRRSPVPMASMSQVPSTRVGPSIEALTYVEHVGTFYLSFADAVSVALSGHHASASSRSVVDTSAGDPSESNMPSAMDGLKTNSSSPSTSNRHTLDPRSFEYMDPRSLSFMPALDPRSLGLRPALDHRSLGYEPVMDPRSSVTNLAKSNHVKSSSVCVNMDQRSCVILSQDIPGGSSDVVCNKSFVNNNLPNVNINLITPNNDVNNVEICQINLSNQDVVTPPEVATVDVESGNSNNVNQNVIVVPMEVDSQNNLMQSSQSDVNTIQSLNAQYVAWCKSKKKSSKTRKFYTQFMQEIHPELLTEQRQVNSQRNRDRYANRTEEEILTQREERRSLHALRREDDITPSSSTSKRRRVEASDKSQSRQEEDEEHRSQRLRNDLNRHLSSQATESIDERNARLNANAQTHRQNRTQGTEEEQVERRNDEARNRNVRRNNESEEQRQNRIQSDRVRHDKRGDKFEHGKKTSDIEPHRLPPYEPLCVSCKGYHHRDDYHVDGKYHKCCGFGTINAEVITGKPGQDIFSVPPYMKDLYLGMHTVTAELRNFREKLPSYNAAFAFATTKYNDVSFHHGVPMFKIQGNVHFNMKKFILPKDDNEQPYGGQIYHLDADTATTRRQSLIADLKDTVVKEFETIMRDENALADSFYRFGKILEEEEALVPPGGQLKRHIMALTRKDGASRNYDIHDYRNEVAVVVDLDKNNEINLRDVIVWRKDTPEVRANGPNGEPQYYGERIFYDNPCIDALLYPMFYVNGLNHSWHYNMKDTNDKRISLAQYTRFMFARRDHDRIEFNPILYGRKLTLRYLVDMWVRIESNNLKFIRQNQVKLKALNYTSLQNYVERRAQAEGMQPGRIVVLPSSYTGGPRWYKERFDDITSLFLHIGRPHFFLTMTCNTTWDDITENVPAGQEPSFAVWMHNKVFAKKKDALIKEICKGQIFGKIKAYCSVVEFQKRGPPHAHMLISLDQVLTLSDYDEYIWAFIPDKNVYPELYEIVLKFMIHGPCGELNPKAQCMVDGVCKRHFPMAFCDATHINDRGFTEFRRPQACANTFKVKIDDTEHDIDNRWVVPYNPYLLLRMVCHLNLTVIGSDGSLAYIFKYMTKGPDKAVVKSTRVDDDGNEVNILDLDEPKQHVEGRYVSAHEADYRINEYGLFDCSHTIIRLKLHDDGEVCTFVPEDAGEVEIEEAIENQKTTLEHAFELWNKDEDARQYRYHELPTYYTYHKSRGFRKRKQGNAIGRMPRPYPANPLFYLRKLLLHVPGPLSWTDLRTIDGVVYETYYDACVEYNLIQEDKLYIETMNEAIHYCKGRELRMFFAQLLAHCVVDDPVDLWHKFRRYMVLDIVRRFRRENVVSIEAIPRDVDETNDDIDVDLNPDGSLNVAADVDASDNFEDEVKKMAELIALRFVVKRMQKMDKDLSMYPTLAEYLESIGGLGNVDDDDMDIAMHQIHAQQMYGSMNDEQRVIMDEVKARIAHGILGPHGHVYPLYFIDGPGGSGKTFTIKALIHDLLGDGKKVCVAAWSGIAATLYPKGRTIHNVFKFPVPFDEQSSSSVQPDQAQGLFLRDVDVFVFDECSMIPKFALHKIHETLSEVMRNGYPFGGKLILLAGDFRQVLPIKEGGTTNEIVNLSLKNYTFWHFFKTLKLTKNMRALPNEIDFVETLKGIGNATLNDENDRVSIPPQCIVPKNTLVQECFGTPIREKRFEDIYNVCILAPTNEQVDAINEDVMNLLPGDDKFYLAIDRTEAINGDDQLMDDSVLQNITSPNFARSRLRLREKSVVMLIRNLNIDDGLCNGTRLVIDRLLNNVIIGRVIQDGRPCNVSTVIPRITLKDEKNGVRVIYRNQFPVRPAFAMTINKSQGQTLNKVGLDLRQDVFSHGQLYVACSRVRSWNSLKVQLPDDNTDGKTLNIVARAVLNE